MSLFELDRSGLRLPLSLITGFLGSGKTTLLNRVLKRKEMADSAVIINELGEIGLDHLLVERVDGDVAVLSSGCVCCTLRGELEEALRALFIKRQRAELPEFKRVLVETTGLADPAPIVATVLNNPMVSHYFRLDAVVTTVDAVNGARQLDQNAESVKQAAIADRLLITKTDLASADAIESLEARLARLNPAAQRLRAIQGEIDPDLLFGCGWWEIRNKTGDVRAWLAEETGKDDRHHHDRAPHHHGHDHGHDHEVLNHDARIRHFSLSFDQPLDWNVVATWLEALVGGAGDNLLRMKGLLNLKGEDQPVVLHGVHHIFHPPVRLGSWPSADRRSRLVFITRDITRAMIEDSYCAFAKMAATDPA
ncbi:MAG: GTP-binding protein [Alphaproteobacteria bacterium]|nr:GTP-binding protein [Alphaproteobacteria bacterium]